MQDDGIENFCQATFLNIVEKGRVLTIISPHAVTLLSSLK
jgi:hypothetical protein